MDQYPNTELAHKLYLGFTQGFKLHYLGLRIPIQSKNLVSAYKNHRETWDKICKEIELGRIGGPFVSLPISNLCISPIGVVPKGKNSGWRLITHLSFPNHNSVYVFIDPNETSVQYTSFDQVVQIIAKYGKGAAIAKCDINLHSDFCPFTPVILIFQVLNLTISILLTSACLWVVPSLVKFLRSLPHF